MAAWGFEEGLARRLKCFHSPPDTSPSAYLERRGERAEWEGKRYMLAAKRTEFNPP